MHETDESAGWAEEDSQRFIDWGPVFTPGREEIERTILALVPAEPEEPFTALELGVGAGWLASALLQRFPHARLIGLDGSPTMLRQTAETLGQNASRADLRPFAPEDRSWREDLPPLRLVTSSLVIHHIDGAGKRELFADMARRLEPGGGLIIADIVAPASGRERRLMADEWDGEVLERSLRLRGGDDGYREFLRQEWNWYRYPDPFDKPSPLAEQLLWLREAGLTGVDAFWVRAGHAVYGGYRP